MSDVPLLALWLLVQIVLIGIVAAHAAENEGNPWLWGLLVFLFGIWGALAYGLVSLFDTDQ